MLVDAIKQPVLDVRNLRASFTGGRGVVPAVRDISLQVSAGETLGLVGESGSGKSTALMAILRMLPAGGCIVGGEVWFAGHNLVSLPESQLRVLRGRQIGLVPQDSLSSLNPLMTVGAHLEEILQTHLGLNRSLACDGAMELLELVSVPTPEIIYRAYPHQLSGGMRQRVTIAMAIACRPQLLLADEPTTALDVITQAQSLDLLRSLSFKFNIATLFVTHNLGLCARLCDRVAVMYAGRIVEIGPCEAIFGQPRHPYTIALLRCLPRIDQVGESEIRSIPGQPPDLAHLVEGCAYAPRCMIVMDRCKEEIPPLLVIGPDHLVACWNTELRSNLLDGVEK